MGLNGKQYVYAKLAKEGLVRLAKYKKIKQLL